MPTKSPVLGCVEQLDDNRIVFLGECEDRPNRFFLGLRNDAGQDTNLILSPEAVAALGLLMKRLPTVPAADRVRFPPPRGGNGAGEEWHWVATVIDT